MECAWRASVEEKYKAQLLSCPHTSPPITSQTSAATVYSTQKPKIFIPFIRLQCILQHSPSRSSLWLLLCQNPKTTSPSASPKPTPLSQHTGIRATIQSDKVVKTQGSATRAAAVFTRSASMETDRSSVHTWCKLEPFYRHWIFISIWNVARTGRHCLA